MASEFSEEDFDPSHISPSLLNAISARISKQMRLDRDFLAAQGIDINNLSAGTLLPNGSVVTIYENGQRGLNIITSIIEDTRNN